MSELRKGVSFRSDPADVDRAHAGQIEAGLLLQRRENGDPDLGGQAVRRNSGRGGGRRRLGRLGLSSFCMTLPISMVRKMMQMRPTKVCPPHHQTHKQIGNFIHRETRSSFLLVSPLYGCRFSCTRALPLSSRHLYAINFSLNARLTVPLLRHLHHIHSAVRDAEAHLKPGKRHAVNALRIALVVRPRILCENACEGIALVLRHAR